ncbi:hypothetical protein NQ317_007207 [Molorchus minor]|uniref:Uncharacterized protein n=1 Tax=Molorchus minor TaxID=1323400 RepID=A0ABQ9JS09_9CUCU|nr:hypothetical protein NQ317_007207 [Molorchus minor]
MSQRTFVYLKVEHGVMGFKFYIKNVPERYGNNVFPTRDIEMVIKCLICKALFKKGENRSFHRLGFASSGNSNDSSEKTVF